MVPALTCRLMAYISAIAERCLETPQEACDSHPTCTLLPLAFGEDPHRSEVPVLETAQISTDEQLDLWLQTHNKSHTAEKGVACRPDIFKVLGKPCKGSRGDLLVRCGGYTTAGECRRDKACLWLRNGWWLDSQSNQLTTNRPRFSVEFKLTYQLRCKVAYLLHMLAGQSGMYRKRPKAGQASRLTLKSSKAELCCWLAQYWQWTILAWFGQQLLCRLQRYRSSQTLGRSQLDLPWQRR